jgi:hypothetical protein
MEIYIPITARCATYLRQTWLWKRKPACPQPTLQLGAFFPQLHKAILCYIIDRAIWGKRRLMSKRPQIAGTYAFKCALLFLASAVFSWGLQAKLSLYKPQQSPSTVTVAKLLTERRSAQTMALLEKALKPDTAWETLNLIPLLVLAQAILILTFEFYQVGMNLCRSRRWDFQDLHLTQRPPPAFF